MKNEDTFYDNMPLEEQVKVLADFLMAKFPQEMGKAGNEGAIEMAIRLLRGELYTSYYIRKAELADPKQRD